VSFASAAAAESVHAVLSGILKAAEEERRRCEEEAATQAREHEEYIRKARLEFASDVWRNAEAIWLLVKAHYKMCHSVIEGEWPDARQQYSMLWQQADRLKESIKIELAEALKDLDDRICAEDGAEVIKTAGSILGDIGRQTLQTDAFWTRWQKHQEAVSGLSPNWNHIPYFLLFSAGYHDAVLSSKIGDWTGVSDGFSVVRSSIDVIRRCFNIHLNGSFEGSVSAGVSRDARLLNDSVERVEMEMMAAFEKKYFEHNGPVATPSGECNGPLR
jgi:hypothetical protein